MPDIDLGTTRIHLSEAAAAKVRELFEKEGLSHQEDAGLRLSLRLGAGCSGRTSVAMALERRPRRRDFVVVSTDRIRIFMDEASAWSLDGLAIDWVESDELGEGFAFGRPRGGDAGCCGPLGT